MPRTGVLNEMSTPRSPLVAKVRPRSVIASRAGPAVFQNAYGPVTALSVDVGKGRRHPPKTKAGLQLLVAHLDPSGGRRDAER
jgi:hypothetical protein